MTGTERKEVMRGSIWMTLISLLFAPVPVLNGLVAGLVGGYRIGNLRRAMLGAALSGVVFGGLAWLVLSLTLPHLLGLSALAVLVWVLVSEAGLLSGAAIGAVSRHATI
jgi:hypothetical protein